MIWEHGFNRWFALGAAAIAAVLALVIWRYHVGPMVIPYRHPQDAAAVFHRKLPPPSTVTAADVVGGPGGKNSLCAGYGPIAPRPSPTSFSRRWAKPPLYRLVLPRHRRSGTMRCN